MKHIGFTGAGGTGKSTIAQQTDCAIPSLVSYLRTSFYGENASYDELTTFEDILGFQYNILYGQIAMEEYNRIQFGHTDLPFFIERSTLDYAAYMLNLAYTHEYMSNSKANSEVYRYVEFCTNYANKNYDALIYFPLGKFTPKDINDKLKERDEESRIKTDSYIQDLLKRIHIPVLRLKPISIKDRLDYIYNFI